MLFQLGGGSPKNIRDYYGRIIKSAKEHANELLMEFEDGTTIRIFDDGRSCCELRYIRTDDSLQCLIGQTLLGVEVRFAKDAGQYEEYHEVAFLDVRTEEGVISFSFHNEHNGYYGGFALAVDECVKA